MKFLLTIFLSFIFYTSVAQLGPIVGTRVQANANLLPPLDTISAPYRVGEIRAQVVGSVAYFYVCRSLSADKKWDVFSMSPLTSVGDLIVGGVSGLPTRLALGPNNYVIKSNGTTILWAPDDAGSSVPGGTTGAIQWRGSTGAFTGDTSVVTIDSTNKRIGLRISNPTHPVTVGVNGSLTGVALYSTSDVTTNYQRLLINATSGNVWAFDLQRGGTGSSGYFEWRVLGVAKFTIDNARVNVTQTFGTNSDNAIDIGSAATNRFRTINLGTSIGIAIGITPTAKIHIGAGTASASTAPFKYTSGTNLTTPENGAKEYDGTNEFLTAGSVRYILAKTLTTTSVLDFPDTMANESSDLTVSLTGAALGDVVSLGVPHASVPITGSFMAWVSATDQITVRYINNDGISDHNPASGTFRISLTKY